MKRAKAALIKRDIAGDVIALAGLALITRGAWMIYEPLGWLLSGALLMIIGLHYSRGK